jgi:hypothetical protein
LKSLKLSNNPINEFVDSSKKKISELYTSTLALFEGLPRAAKVIMTEFAAILLVSVFAKGAVGSAIKTALLASMTVNGIFLAEAIGVAFTGNSFINKVGGTFGKVLSLAVTQVVRSIPDILNTTIAALSAIMQGFAKALPGVGGVFEGLLNFASKVGMAGPLGVLGTALFGYGAFNTLKLLDLLPKSIENLFEHTKKGKTQQGMLEKVLDTFKASDAYTKFLNPLTGNDPTRQLSILSLVASQLGIFDSLFASSPLAKYAVDGGLLYLALFGNAGLTSLVGKFKQYVLDPLSTQYKSLLSLMSTAPSLMGGMVGGAGGAAAAQASTMYGVVSGIAGAFATKAMTYVKPTVSVGAEWLKGLLFGNNTSNTLTLIKGQIAAFFSNIGDLLKKGAALVSFGNTGNGLFSKLGGAFSAVYDYLAIKTSNFWNTITTLHTQGSARAAGEAVGGAYGILYRAFQSRFVRFAALAAVGMFAASAFAGQDKKDEKPETAWDRLKDTLKGFVIENPLVSIFSTTTALLGGAIAALVYFRREATRILKTDIYTDMDEATRRALMLPGTPRQTQVLTPLTGMAGMRAKLGNVGRYVATPAGAGIIAGGAAATIGGMDAMDAINTGLTVAMVAATFRKTIASGLAMAWNSTVVRASVTALFSLKGLLAGAVLATAGAAYLFFFGEKGEFFKELDRATKGIQKFFGVKDKTPDTRLSTKETSTGKDLGLNATYNVADINEKKLSDSDKEKLAAKIKELQSIISRAQDEKDSQGIVTPATMDAFSAANRGLDAYTKRLTRETNPVKGKFSEVLDENAKENKNYSYAADIVAAIGQAGIDAMYYVERGILYAQRKLNKSPEMKEMITRRLDEMASVKDTVYNVYYTPLSASDRKVRDLSRLAENPDLIQSDVIEERINNTKDFYLKWQKLNVQKNLNQNKIFSNIPQDRPTEMMAEAGAMRMAEALSAKLRFSQESNATKKFQQDFAKIQAQFKGVGAELDVSKIFARDEIEYNDVKNAGKELEELGERLKTTKDIAQRNNIIVHITEIVEKVTAQQRTAERLAGSTKSKYLLPDVLKQNDIVGNSDFIDRLDRAQSEFIMKQVDTLQKLEEGVRKRRSIKAATGLFPPIEKDDVFKEAMRDAKQDMPPKATTEAEKEAQDKTIQKSVANYRLFVMREMKKTSPLLYAQSIADSIGVSFDSLIRKRGGVDGAIEQLTELREAFIKLRSLRLEGGTDKEILDAQLAVERSLYNIKASNRDLNAFIGELGSLGGALGSISIEDFLTISPKTLIGLRQATDAANTFKREIELIGEDWNKDTILRAAYQRIEGMRKLLDAQISAVGNTVAKLRGIYKESGANDTSFMSSEFLNSTVKGLVEFQRAKLKVQSLENNPRTQGLFAEFMGTEDGATIFKTLDDHQRSFLEKAREILQSSYGDKMKRINETFEIGLSNLDFATLESQTREVLNAFALFFKRNLDSIARTGTALGGASAKAFLEESEKITKSVKIIKFFKDLGKAVGEVMTDGIGAAYEKLQKLVPNSNISEDMLQQMPKSERQQLIRSLTNINALRELSRLSGLPENFEKIISKFDGTNADALVEELKRLPQDLLDNNPFKSDIEQILREQSSPQTAGELLAAAASDFRLAVDTFEKSLQRFGTKDQLMYTLDPVKKASGGSVWGAGTATSDSIPALLSNGEFVVNAAAASRNRKLLERINRDDIPKFAKGGLSNFLSTAPNQSFNISDFNTKYFNFDDIEEYTKQQREIYSRSFGSSDNFKNLSASNKDRVREFLANDIDQRFRMLTEDFQSSKLEAVKNWQTSHAGVEIKEFSKFIKLAHATARVPDITKATNPFMAYEVALHELGHLSSQARSVAVDKMGIADVAHLAWRGGNFKETSLLDAKRIKNIKPFFEAKGRYSGIDVFTALQISEEIEASNIAKSMTALDRNPWKTLSKAYGTYLATASADGKLNSKILKDLQKLSATSPGEIPLNDKLGSGIDLLKELGNTGKTVLGSGLDFFRGKFKDKFSNKSTAGIITQAASSTLDFVKGLFTAPNIAGMITGGLVEDQVKQYLKLRESSVELADSFAGSLPVEARGIIAMIGAMLEDATAMSIGALSGGAATKGVGKFLKMPGFAGGGFAMSRRAFLGAGLAAADSTLPSGNIKNIERLAKYMPYIMSVAGSGGVTAGSSTLAKSLASAFVKTAGGTAWLGELVFNGAYLTSDKLLRPFIDKQIKDNTDSENLGDLIYELLNKTPNFATGGSVWGAGTATSDSIPAWLSNGEFVVNAASASKYRKLLEQINNAPGFKLGGDVIANDNIYERRDGVAGYSTSIQPTIPTSDFASAMAKAIMTALRESGTIDSQAARGKNLGLDVNTFRFGGLDDPQRAEYNRLLLNAENLKSKAKPGDSLSVKAAEEAVAELEDFLNRFMPSYVSKVISAGNSMLNTVDAGLNAAIQDLMKGKRDGNLSALKTFFRRIADTLTNSIINEFTKGMMDSLTGQTGLLTTGLKSLGSSLFKGGSGLVSGLIGMFSETPMPWTELGFASGGQVTGIGTGTSDSIPAMLSNGEFVVNAKATSRYVKLLTAINTGTLPHFADGGYVGSIGKDVTTTSSTSSGNTSVFNISITGDISMQTRRQVMSMIPEIAAGTNAHNREINYSYGKR